MHLDNIICSFRHYFCTIFKRLSAINITVYYFKNDPIPFACTHSINMCIKSRSNNPDQATLHHAISQVSNLDLAFFTVNYSALRVANDR
jgi:hypothetical protein